LNATGDPKRGLTQARFEGNPVRFTERREAGAKPGTREGTAQRLDLKLAGQLDAIDDAEFRDRVRFTDGSSQASAERAVYKSGADQLELHTVNGRVPHVERRDLAVDGATILLDVGADRLDATGNVRTLSRPSGRETSKRSGLFDDKQDVIGAAARLQFDGGAGTATYTGAASVPASLTQGASRVAAQQIVLDDKSGNLTARGSVDSTMEIEDQAGAGAGRGEKAGASRLLHRITAEQLVYEDQARRAIYTSTAPAQAKLTRPDGSTEAARIEVLLAAGSRTLRELRASGQVYARLEPDSEAKGDRLVYNAETQLYTLYGQPGQSAVAKVPDEERKGCWKLTGPEIRFKRSGAQPGTDQRTRSETIECRVSIR
jgi:lipopolysaccharide export system protein LptA